MVEEKKKSELSGRGNLTDRFRSTNNDSDSFSDVQSVKSASTSTFRDTEIEEDMATSLMKMQSLTSIVNDPKSDSFLK
jgi:hypothetical protein